MISISLDEQSPGNEQELTKIAKLLHQSRRVLVVTGAGISCSAGIPDFRSSSGLYNMQLSTSGSETPTARKSLRGEDMFDSSVLSSPSRAAVFCKFITTLHSHCQKASPTETHTFLSHLAHTKKLTRCYTQNIDNLEAKTAHLRPVDPLTLTTDSRMPLRRLGAAYNVVQLHGTLENLYCSLCHHSASWDRQVTRAYSNGSLPACARCADLSAAREARGKRPLPQGVLRPNIVLYNEPHPAADETAELINLDTTSAKARQPDFLLVIGTTLKIDGVKRLVRQAAAVVRSRGGSVVFVNKGGVPSAFRGIFDYHVDCECDLWIGDLRKRVPEMFKVQSTLDNLVSKRTAEKKAKAEGEPEPEAEAESVAAKSSLEPPKTPRAARLIKRKALQSVTPDSAHNKQVCLSPSSSGRIRAAGKENVPPGEPVTPSKGCRRMIGLSTPPKSPTDMKIKPPSFRIKNDVSDSPMNLRRKSRIFRLT